MQRTTSEPQRIKAFLAFCRSKPADEVYDGGDGERCALAQYGFRYAVLDDVGSEIYWAAVFPGWVGNKPDGWSTFGALADRLERALAQQVQA